MSVVGKTVGIFTLGCRVNQYESQAIAERLENAGVRVLHAPAIPCDAYLVHTCAVTAESSRKSRKFVRRAVRANPAAPVVVCGCEAEREAAKIAAIDGVSAVVGNHTKNVCADLLLRYLADGKPSHAQILRPPLADATFEPMRITRSERTRAYVKIEDGCNGKCAYCIIAALRGPVRSRTIKEAVAEVRDLVARGYREVVLTGIETSAYAYGLAELLAALHEIPGLARIRLSSMDPAAITEDFVRAVAALPRVMPHYHLSLQSGCSTTLAAMRRRYNAEGAAAAVQRLQTHISDLSLTADIIVGFPGETEADFQETKAFLASLPLHAMHIFPFSPRPGTPAATMENQVPESVKHARLAELQATADAGFAAAAERFVGRSIPVLFETEQDGICEGHSPQMMSVRAAGGRACIGEILSVQITGAGKSCLEGDILFEEVQRCDR